MPDAKNVEVMQAGVKANGNTFELADFREMIRAFDEQRLAGRLPVKLGHSDDDSEPAQGWITALRISGDKLLADLSDVPDELVEEIKAGRWRYVSIELLQDAERGGKKYEWMPDGLALLGAVRPAFDALKGLADVFSAGVRGVKFAQRLAFSHQSESEADQLRKQNMRLQQQMIHLEFEAAIAGGRVLPREREAFNRRYGETGTIEDARTWIASSPKSQATAHATRQEQRQTFAEPEGELIARTYERIKFEKRENARDITYYEASLLVIREDKELARAYLDLPAKRSRE